MEKQDKLYSHSLAHIAQAEGVPKIGCWVSNMKLEKTT
jgi:hypothetical protein